MNELIFKLLDRELIKIVTKNEVAFDKIDPCCSELYVFFLQGAKELKIGQKAARELFEAFITCLKKACVNKLQLHQSLKANLGFLQNEYYQDKQGFVKIAPTNGAAAYWVGYDYKICSSVGDACVTTWIYNDMQGNIILEVTKNYPWHLSRYFIELQDDPNFVSYEVFMQNYEPTVLKRVIPHNVAALWLKQSLQLYRTFFRTQKKYLRAYKENNW